MLSSLAVLAVSLLSARGSPAFDISISPAAFSAQDAGLYAHRLTLTLSEKQGELRLFQDTAEYLQDYQARLSNKRSTLGLLPFEDGVLEQTSVRLSKVKSSIEDLRVSISVLDTERAKWAAQSKPGAIVALEPSYRLFPDRRPMPSLYLPLVDRSITQFKLTVTTNNSLKL